MKVGFAFNRTILAIDLLARGMTTTPWSIQCILLATAQFRQEDREMKTGKQGRLLIVDPLSC
jgi:hypothetical protein